MDTASSRVIGFPKRARPAVNVQLWEGRGRPAEAVLRAALEAEGYQALRWAVEPATGYPPHAHIYPELVWVITGSLTLILPAEDRLLELGPGDRVEVSQGILHGTMAGPDGATFLVGTR